VITGKTKGRRRKDGHQLTLVERSLNRGEEKTACERKIVHRSREADGEKKEVSRGCKHTSRGGSILIFGRFQKNGSGEAKLGGRCKEGQKPVQENSVCQKGQLRGSDNSHNSGWKD